MATTEKRDGIWLTVTAVIVVAVICVAFALWTGVWDFGELEESGWIHHDKMTQVRAGSWTTGEYKNCLSVNDENTESVFLESSPNQDAYVPPRESKMFKVRFYGRTHRNDKDKNFVFHWKCRKNSDADPVISCESAAPADEK